MVQPVPPPRVLTRRELTVAGLGGAGLLLAAQVPDAWGARLLRQSAKIGPGRFRDGVASGDPTDSSMVFWSRMRTDLQRSGARLVVATDPGLTRTVATAVVPTSRAVDGALKVRVTGLRPDTVYHYVWQSAQETSEVGRTKTFKPADSEAPVRIAYSSCQRWAEGFFNGHLDAAADEPLDLYVFVGDYTYEYEGEDEGLPDGRRDLAASNDLRSYRDKLQLYRSDPGLRELHRTQPVVHTWDDHEVEDNYNENNPAPSAQQRAAGYTASTEWLPRMPAGGERHRIYRSYRLGKQAELFMLDQRQYRTGNDDGQPLRLLGDGQLSWFTSGLRRSDARWKLVGNPVMFVPLGVGGRPINPDQWDGYPAEQRRVRDTISGADGGPAVPNTMFLTGDIHTYFTARVLADGTSGPSVATEYVAGSVSSSGLPALGGLATTAVNGANPWITYANGTDHGFGRVELGAAQARVTYRAAPVLRPGAGSRDLAVYTQAFGANDYVTARQEPGGNTATARAGGVARGPVRLPEPRSARALRSDRAPNAALARRRRREERLAARTRERLERRAATGRSGR